MNRSALMISAVIAVAFAVGTTLVVQIRSLETFPAFPPASYMPPESDLEERTSGEEPANDEPAPQTDSWLQFTNELYGYTLKFPPEVDGPISHCGGVGIETSPVESCYEVEFRATGVISDHHLLLVAKENPKRLDLMAFAEEELASDPFVLFVQPLKLGSIGTMEAPTAVYIRAHQGSALQSETQAYFVAMNSGDVLRVTYPTAHADIYGPIASTLELTP